MAEFDYIIVGAGSAGSALAARLSEKQDSQVLLLEAGPSGRHPFLHIPIGYGKVFYDQRYNWKYHTNPEPHLNNRSIYWPRGKVLGGSSSINAMVYVRGHKQDYEEWNAVAPGWGLGRCGTYVSPHGELAWPTTRRTRSCWAAGNY